MSSTDVLRPSGVGFFDQLAQSLSQVRDIEARKELGSLSENNNDLVQTLKEISQQLRSSTHSKEADVFDHVVQICRTPKDYGGLGLEDKKEVEEADISEVIFLIGAWLEALNSADKSRQSGLPIDVRPTGRRPMTLTEKIFEMHNVEATGSVQSGDVIRVSVDWIMASEASWSGMEKTYDQLGKPGIFRNDRFWLAGDHVVDPRVNKHPTIAKLIESSEKAKKVFKMTEYQGMNYTIMHTEFYRERAQPGMIVIGSDSHTCSSGAVGCLAIGLGAADVTMALVTGEIWFRVPECVNIQLVGKPGKGVSGKDVILYILQQLKRNTVAADRVVEYTGPGLEYLSPDARFAISNMTTEFGGITGVFVPDGVTNSFVSSRKVARHKSAAMYFRPDEDAVYAETHVIDLAKTESFVAKYPNPDDVVPVSEVAGTSLDGCFIGACTTAEEDLILGALVLEQGLKTGLRPVGTGKRKVVPGSRPILDKLRKSGLAAIYEQAGFEIGIPGCSYCVGMSADKAAEGEVWLSSQNRNFENRMGKGSIGNLASAATVAASSFNMTIADPRELIDQIDPARWESLKGRGSLPTIKSTEPHYVEPPRGSSDEVDNTGLIPNEAQATGIGSVPTPDSEQTVQGSGGRDRMISGKVQKLGDFIDTDALAPAQYLIEAKTNEELGTHCLEFTNPSFRARVKDGFNVVVAGKAFGCGSSREQAVSALLGTGVQCVIAKSFAFIYSRNQPSLGLLGITMTRADFFEAVKDGSSIDVDLDKNVIIVEGQEFPFQLSSMEKELLDIGGITPAFIKYGKQIFDALCSGGSKPEPKRDEEATAVTSSCGSSSKPLQW